MRLLPPAAASDGWQSFPRPRRQTPVCRRDWRKPRSPEALALRCRVLLVGHAGRPPWAPGLGPGRPRAVRSRPVCRHPEPGPPLPAGPAGLQGRACAHPRPRPCVGQPVLCPSLARSAPIDPTSHRSASCFPPPICHLGVQLASPRPTKRPRPHPTPSIHRTPTPTPTPVACSPAGFSIALTRVHCTSSLPVLLPGYASVSPSHPPHGPVGPGPGSRSGRRGTRSLETATRWCQRVGTRPGAVPPTGLFPARGRLAARGALRACAGRSQGPPRSGRPSGRGEDPGVQRKVGL